MGAYVGSLNLRTGESITITINGSVEHSLNILALEDGYLRVFGPMNQNSRQFRVSRRGWIEEPRPEEGEAE